MRPWVGTNGGPGSRSLGRPPAGAVTPRGIEPCVLTDRPVGTERFRRRRASARQRLYRKVEGPDLGRLFAAARRRARHQCREPSRCRVRNGWPTPKRLTKTQRHTPLGGVGPGFVFLGQVVEDIKPPCRRLGLRQGRTFHAPPRDGFFLRQGLRPSHGHEPFSLVGVIAVSPRRYIRGVTPRRRIRRW